MEFEPDSVPYVSAAQGGASRLPPGVVVAGKDGIIRSVNDAICRLFGYPKEELVGSSIKKLMPTEIADQHDMILERYFASGAFKASTTRIVFGLAKSGVSVKLRLALSYMVSDSTPLISALIDEVLEHSFSLITDATGIITTVTGNPEETCGYSAHKLIGCNVSIICPSYISHNNYWLNYSTGKQSPVVGHVRNRELRHCLGHIIPIALEVNELSNSPLTFSATITEIEQSMEGMVTASADGIVVSVDTSCALILGYEQGELIGMSLSVVLPSLATIREGKTFIVCMHKDGSHFFVSLDIQEFMFNGETCYRGIIHRTLPNKATKQRSLIQYEDVVVAGDLLDWYEVSNKVLGSGFFGHVKMATHRLTGLSVAIKTLQRKQYNDAGLPYPPRELDLLKALRHPNIGRMFHSVETEGAIFLVSELISGGELFDYIAQQNHLSEESARGFMRQIISAVDHIHRCGIVHRDLKLENILLNNEGKVKVIDLGLGNFFDASGNNLLNSFGGSPDYAPPELWESKPYYGPEVDIWSLGVILYIMVTGFIPFNSSSDVIELRYHWPQTIAISQNLKNLIELIFCKAEKRCTLEDVILHPWLNNDGKLNAISRTPVFVPPKVLNDTILRHMEHLGLPKEHVEKAVLEQEHNQLDTTYALLEFQLEETLRRRRGSILSSQRGSNSPSPLNSSRTSATTPPPTSREGSHSGASSPAPKNESPRDAFHDSQKKCIIS